MSSVRIKKMPSGYSVLRDASLPQSPVIAEPFPRQSPESLTGGAELNSRNHDTNEPTRKPRMRRRTTSGASFDSHLSFRHPIVSRPRSGSRVVEHLRNSRKLSDTLSPLNHNALISTIYEASSKSRPSPSPRQPPKAGHIARGEETDVIQGSQAAVAMRMQHGDRTSGTREDVPAETETVPQIEELHHHDDIVEHLDVIDPQVSTVANLANAANAILIPPLHFYSRKPTVILSSPTRRQRIHDTEKGTNTNTNLDDMDDALDRHVEDVLTRRAKLKRTMQGVWSFLKTPMGIITGIYGFLVVFWGTALVLFLVKWIDFHNDNTQGFWIEVASQIECGLFTATGIGLIPPRALDTYRIYKIWWYKRQTRILREKAGLPQLFDIDDLPDPVYDPYYVHVLSEIEQRDLHHQQERFRKSQTWYRPHGTETHRAFPINMALWICLFIDGNSIFQIILSSCMWSMNRFERPPWTTGTLIPASFLCGIISAVLIWRGGQKTRRLKEVEETLRVALAMEKDERHQKASSKQIRPPSSSPETWKRPRESNGESMKPASIVTPAIDEHMIIPNITNLQ
ncbi:hypothetical protein BJ138DRAFT_1000597 [Hygrophoropsis aurantiaca]|uniref:Uncharacterized protein n=1 Tax=Hygrophoropsis aurantiaca TaxID=72124 RepID=A0ACB8ALF2_9AGAM|nr:hypothetical protein BJ138DRAFT_1000597 [Hygrophoropsis aurantiaca]